MYAAALITTTQAFPTAAAGTASQATPQGRRQACKRVFADLVRHDCRSENFYDCPLSEAADHVLPVIPASARPLALELSLTTVTTVWEQHHPRSLRAEVPNRRSFITTTARDESQVTP